MAKRRIHIEHLEIRLPHASLGNAKQLAAGIGREVMAQIVETTNGSKGTFRIDRLSTGNIRGTEGDIAKTAATGVAAVLRRKLDGGRN